MEDVDKTQVIKNIIEKHNGQLGGILAILEKVQGKYGYVSADALKTVSRETGRSLEDLYGVVTFYKAFSLAPKGKHLVSVCVGTACHVRGAPAIAGEFEAQLGVKAGRTTPDGEFTLETVNCLGACALGPIVVVDGHYFSNVEKTQVRDIIEKTLEGLDKVDVTTDKCIFPVEVSCPRCNHSLMDDRNPIEGCPSIRVTVSTNHKHGWLRFSSLYGSYSTESEFPIAHDEVINFFCPHCHAELVSSTDCPECGAPMVSMIVRGGGVIEMCSRWECKVHMLDLSGVSM